MAKRSTLSGAALAAALLLAACAQPADVGRMTVRPEAVVLADHDSLANAVCVEKVVGGKTTNPLWVSEVDNQAFLAALQGSLRNKGMLAEAPAICRYGVEAHLLGLSQPFIGFDVEVTANVNYRVTKPGLPDPIFLETITSAYTARFSADKVLWAQRLKSANEGAVRKNIRQFIEGLTARQPGA